jgi:hypothetical protein
VRAGACVPVTIVFPTCASAARGGDKIFFQRETLFGTDDCVQSSTVTKKAQALNRSNKVVKCKPTLPDC